MLSSDLEYLSQLSNILTKILLYGEESRQRDINPWAHEGVDSYELVAGEVREMVAEEVAQVNNII